MVHAKPLRKLQWSPLVRKSFGESCVGSALQPVRLNAGPTACAPPENAAAAPCGSSKSRQVPRGWSARSRRVPAVSGQPHPVSGLRRGTMREDATKSELRPANSGALDRSLARNRCAPGFPSDCRPVWKPAKEFRKIFEKSIATCVVIHNLCAPVSPYPAKR